MAGEDELIAAGREVEDVREEIGAASLAYLSLDGLQEATPPARGLVLPRLPDEELPDPDPREPPPREAPLRAHHRVARSA